MGIIVSHSKDPVMNQPLYPGFNGMSQSLVFVVVGSNMEGPIFRTKAVIFPLKNGEVGRRSGFLSGRFFFKLFRGELLNFGGGG